MFSRLAAERQPPFRWPLKEMRRVLETHEGAVDCVAPATPTSTRPLLHLHLLADGRCREGRQGRLLVGTKGGVHVSAMGPQKRGDSECSKVTSYDTLAADSSTVSYQFDNWHEGR